MLELEGRHPGEEHFEAGVDALGGDFRAGEDVEVFVEHAVEDAAVGLVGVVPGLRGGVVRAIADHQVEQVLQDPEVGVVLVDQLFHLLHLRGVEDPLPEGLQIGVLAYGLTHC